MTVDFCRVRFRLDVSFVALVCLMLIFCQQRIVIVSLFSSMCHECGHLALMCCFRDRPKAVTMSAFGMRIDRKNGMISYKHEALIAMGGIMVNSAIALFGLTVYQFSYKIWALELVFVNVFIAIINMIPVGMLDFARSISCFLMIKYDMKKAQRISDVLSTVFLFAFILFCLIYCFFIKVNISLVAVTVYLITSYKKRS